MKLLLLGAGGREHALAWKICKSSQLEKLYVSPGNAGTSEIAENIAMDINDFDAVGNFCVQKKIDVLVVGPEQPLVNGIHDYFERKCQNCRNLYRICYFLIKKIPSSVEISEEFGIFET